MPDARTVATQALLAVVDGDEREALHLLDQVLTETERANLRGHARRLADLADARLRCPMCGEWAADDEVVIVELGPGADQSRWRWHRACHELDLSRRASAGDRRAQMMLVRHAANRLNGAP